MKKDRHVQLLIDKRFKHKLNKKLKRFNPEFKVCL